MLVRDENGKLIIISRSDCKNEYAYNEKIYNIRLNYTKIYKSVIINTNMPKVYIDDLNIINLKNASDD